MTVPSAKGTVIIDALETLYGQFQGAPIIDAIVASYAIQAQEIENMLIQLWVLRSLELAENDQLDVLGGIVGEDRQGRSDADYSIAIGARIRTNKSNATIEDILSAMVAAENRTYNLNNHGGAAITVEAAGPIGTTNQEELWAVLQNVKGGGVRADLLYHTADDDEVFILASGSVEESSTTQGLANDALTTGGYLSDTV